MTFPNGKNSDQGFSLVESLIAIIILGIVMTGSMAFYTFANAQYYHGLHHQTATWLADSQMETCKSLGASALPAANCQSGTTSLGAVIQGLTASQTLLLTQVSGTTYYDVKVTITWTEPKEASRSVVLETYIN